MMDEKGQAAVEYLLTYGWALLTILIVVGALAYFGFLDPSQFVPDRCWFGAQMVCEDYQINADNDAVNWKVRNNFARSIEILGVVGVDERYPFTTSDCTFTPSPPIIAVGEVAEIRCTLASGADNIFDGDKYGIPARITFQRNDTGSPPQHNVTGEVYATAS